MKNIYSYTDYTRVSYTHRLNEGLGFLGKFNPVKIITNAVETVRDFLIWRKESKDPRFKKVKNVLNLFSDPRYNSTFDELSDIQSTLIEKIDEYKDESKKEYSELKYHLAEEIEELYPVYSKKWQQVTEMLYVDYYQEHGSELYDDVKDVVEFLSISKWYIKSRPKVQPILNKFMQILGTSDIKKTMDNLL
jgi:hypothetical protein